MAAPLSRDAKIVVGAFLVSGAVHLVKPEVYEPLMPSWLPAHREVCGRPDDPEAQDGGRHGRRPEPDQAQRLIKGVRPRSSQGECGGREAVDAARSRNVPLKVAAYARLPLQFPMISGAWRTWRAAS